MNTKTTNQIERILHRCKGAGRDALIPVLQEIQEACGYLPREPIARLASQLNIPASKVYCVATFYNQFRFHPPGRFHIQVCRGTACHVKGSAKVLEAVCSKLDISPGKTTRDGLFSLEVVACIGACGLSPVISINGEFYASVTPDNVRNILDSYKDKVKSDDASKQ